MIAEDDSTTDVEMSNGLTLAELARKQLLPGLEHRMVIATTFMFPSASERRVRIIATLMIMYFIFDGKTNNRLENELLVLVQAEANFHGKLDKIEETPEGAPVGIPGNSWRVYADDDPAHKPERGVLCLFQRPS